MPVLGFVVGPSTSSESSFSAVAVYSSAVLRSEKSSSKRSGTICDKTLRAIKDAIAGKAGKLTFSMLWLQWTPKVVLTVNFTPKVTLSKLNVNGKCSTHTGLPRDQ